MSDKKEYPNSFMFFVNTRKRPDKRDPDYDGKGEVTCEKCNHVNRGFFNIWSKSGAKGDFWSGVFKHMTQGAGVSAPSSGGGRSLSSGSQADMGYARNTAPQENRAPRGEQKDFGQDIDDSIPF
jgi:hypothetical protein